MYKISIVGLGKLGAPLAATVAARGFEVIGIDTNKSVVEKINSAKAPVQEPGLDKLIKQHRLRIKATSDYSYAINGTDITFIIVPTPSNANGDFSNRFVTSAIESIGRILSQKDKYHLVVVTSTVLPRSMDSEIVPRLVKSSGKKLNSDFGVCYNPEFIALGQVIENLLNPDLVLIGQSDQKSGDILEKFYRKFCLNKPPVVRMNFINAEIAKIALNSYITTKISFANTLAQICERVIGGDVDLVTKALGLDLRIGSKYLKGALPFGGPCFPRDNRAFFYFAQKLRVSAQLAEATDRINKSLIQKLIRQIEATFDTKKSKIVILGLAYKNQTDVVEESAGLKIANSLSKKYSNVYVWDPRALKAANGLLNNSVTVAKSLKECLLGADLIVIATPWDDFKKIKPAYFAKSDRKPTLLDCWRLLDPLKYQRVVNYRTIGQSEFSLGNAK